MVNHISFHKENLLFLNKNVQSKRMVDLKTILEKVKMKNLRGILLIVYIKTGLFKMILLVFHFLI